jgi:hypothetical protein
VRLGIGGGGLHRGLQGRHGRTVVGRRHGRCRQVQPRHELSDRLREVARAQIRDAEIDEDRGRRRQQRNRALQARSRARHVTLLAERRSEHRVRGARRRIELHALAKLLDRALACAAVPQGRTEVVSCVRRLRTDRNRALEVLERRRKLPLLAEHVPHEAVRVRLRRLLGQQRRQLRVRRRHVASRGSILGAREPPVGRRRGSGGHAGLRALLVQRLRQPVVALAQLRVELHGLFERRNRSRQVTCLAKRLPELVVHTRIRRIPLGDDVQVLECLLGLPCLAERHPEVHVRCEAVRLERQRLLECRRRLAEVAALHERRAEVRVRAAVRRIELDGLAQFGNRAGEIRRCRERDAEPVARFRRLGRELHGPAERLERPRVVVLAHVRHPEQHVQPRVLRVLLQLRLKLLCCLGDGHRVCRAGRCGGLLRDRLRPRRGSHEQQDERRHQPPARACPIPTRTSIGQS